MGEGDQIGGPKRDYTNDLEEFINEAKKLSIFIKFLEKSKSQYEIWRI